MDDKFVDEYDAAHVNEMMMNTRYDTGYDIGFEEGKEKGIEQGSRETLIEIAKNLLKNGMSNEDVILNTKITKKELENLIKNKE